MLSCLPWKKKKKTKITVDAASVGSDIKCAANLPMLWARREAYEKRTAYHYEAIVVGFLWEFNPTAPRETEMHEFAIVKDCFMRSDKFSDFICKVNAEARKAAKLKNAMSKQEIYLAHLAREEAVKNAVRDFNNSSEWVTMEVCSSMTPQEYKPRTIIKFTREIPVAAAIADNTENIGKRGPMLSLRNIAEAAEESLRALIAVLGRGIGAVLQVLDSVEEELDESAEEGVQIKNYPVKPTPRLRPVVYHKLK